MSNHKEPEVISNTEVSFSLRYKKALFLLEIYKMAALIWASTMFITFSLLLIKEFEKYKSFKASEIRMQFGPRVTSEILVKIFFLNGTFFTKVLRQQYDNPPKLQPPPPHTHCPPPLQAALPQLTKFSSSQNHTHQWLLRKHKWFILEYDRT